LSDFGQQTADNGYYQLCPTAHPQLAVEPFHVRADGVRRHFQRAGNLGLLLVGEDAAGVCTSRGDKSSRCASSAQASSLR
jgi:hypothetical protein